MTDFEIYSLVFRALRESNKPMTANDISTAISDRGYTAMALTPNPEAIYNAVKRDVASNDLSFFYINENSNTIRLSRFGSTFNVFCVPTRTSINAFKDDISDFRQRVNRLCSYVDCVACENTVSSLLHTRVLPFIQMLGYDIFASNIALGSGNSVQLLDDKGACLLSVRANIEGERIKKKSKSDTDALLVFSNKTKAVTPALVSVVLTKQTSGVTMVSISSKTSKNKPIKAVFALLSDTIDTYIGALTAISKDYFNVDNLRKDFVDLERFDDIVDKELACPSSELINLFLRKAGITCSAAAKKKCIAVLKESIRSHY